MPRDLPLASLKVMCRASRRPGTFATALGVLQRLVPCAQPNEPSDLILNLTGVAGYDCHDLRYTVYTCYGTLQPNNADQLPVIADVVEHIDICPVRSGDFKRWEDYAESLVMFLDGRDGRTWAKVPMADSTRLRVQCVSKQPHTAR